MARISNKVFSERELPSIDVCSFIMGYGTIYSGVDKWRWVYCDTVYFVIMRCWRQFMFLT